jgi:hypothetical protein
MPHTNTGSAIFGTISLSYPVLVTSERMQMKNYPEIGVQIPQILLPKAGIDLHRWAVIACDQFTSQPEYWHQVEEIVGDAPSTLDLVLPELYLETPAEEQRIQPDPSENARIHG